MKRLLCILLALCMICTVLPSAFADENEPSNTYNINGVDVRFDDAATLPGECLQYASDIYEIIWGYEFSTYRDDADNYLRELELDELTLTEEHLKEYVSQAALGSCIRVCHRSDVNSHDVMGHSQIIVGKDEEGFTVLEGGIAAYPHCREHYYTWEKYLDMGWLGGTYEYIKYIKCPHTPAIVQERAYSGSFKLLCSEKTLMAEPWETSIPTRKLVKNDTVKVVGYAYNSYDGLWYRTDKGDYISAVYLYNTDPEAAAPSGFCGAELKVTCKAKPVFAGMNKDSAVVDMLSGGKTVKIAGYAFDKDNEAWLLTSDGFFMQCRCLEVLNDEDRAKLSEAGIVLSPEPEEESSFADILNELWYIQALLPLRIQSIFE